MRWPGRRELPWLTGMVLAVLLFTSLPYLVGWLTSTPESVFQGFVIDLDDVQSHLAKMQLGYAGHWSYTILFTPEPHAPAPINFFYLGLGHLARLFRIDTVVTYHAARLVLGALFLVTAYAFMAAFLQESTQRRLAFFMLCFASGLGWLALLVGGSFVTGGLTPVDFWFIEMYGFFTVMLFPHTCLALTAMLIVLASGVDFCDNGRWLSLIGAALAGLVLALVHPYSLLVVDLSLGVFCLLRWWQERHVSWRQLAGLAIVVIAPLPAVIWQYLAIAGNPVLAAWQAQSTTLSPPVWYYVLGYGVVFPLAIPGAWWAIHRSERRWRLLPLWLLIVAPLLYAPVVFNLQRRMIEGAQVPLCLLATIGMTVYLVPWVESSRLAGWLGTRGYAPQRLGLLVRNLVVGLALPSTLFLVISACMAAAGNPDLRVSGSEAAAVSWLGENTGAGDTLLCSQRIGGYVPAAIGHRTFLGHWAETIDPGGKQRMVVRFFGQNEGGETFAETARRQLLADYGIRYVFYGPGERALGGFDPSRVDFLEPVFRQGDVSVYRVAF